MAKTEYLKTEAGINRVNPALVFSVRTYSDRQISCSFVKSGRLYSGTNKLLGFIHNDSGQNDWDLDLSFLNREKVSELARKQDNRTWINETLSVELTASAITQIENERNTAHEKLVSFRLELDVLTFWTAMKRLSENEVPGLAYQPELQVARSTSSHPIQIPHSDWVNKYCPTLGVGAFILVELRQPTIGNVSAEWSNTYSIIKQGLLELESNIRKGEWQSVIVGARQIFEDIKVFSGNTADIPLHDDFKNAFRFDNHSQAGIDSLEKGIKAFFDYCSKFIHTKDRLGNSQPRPNATKEDAEFVFALLTSFVSLLASKLKNLS